MCLIMVLIEYKLDSVFGAKVDTYIMEVLLMKSDFIFDRVVERRGTGSVKWDMRDDDVIPIWVADMDFESPREVQDAIVERARHGIYGYTIESVGLYKAVTDWLSRRHDWTIEQDWIAFTPGVMPGIRGLLQALTRPGDKVILQSPVYPPFFSAIRDSGCHVLNNQLKYEHSRYTMDFADLEEKAKDPRTKALILCSPHNPVGRVWTRDELTMLGNICMEHGVVVISDEIHSDLNNKGIMSLLGISKDVLVQSIIFHDLGKSQPEFEIGQTVDPLDEFEESCAHAERSADIAAHFYQREDDVIWLIKYHHHPESQLPADFPNHLRPMLRLLKLVDGLSAALTRRNGKITLDVDGTKVYVYERNPHPDFDKSRVVDLFTGETREIPDYPDGTG
jgi:hypothetical protein